jgi:hypothetical protein
VKLITLLLRRLMTSFEIISIEIISIEIITLIQRRLMTGFEIISIETHHTPPEETDDEF